MRTIFVLLLAANAAYLLWHLGGVPGGRPSSEVEPEAAAGRRLVLLDELKPSAAGTDSPSAPEDPRASRVEPMHGGIDARRAEAAGVKQESLPPPRDAVSMPKAAVPGADSEGGTQMTGAAGMALARREEVSAVPSREEGATAEDTALPPRGDEPEREPPVTGPPPAAVTGVMPVEARPAPPATAAWNETAEPPGGDRSDVPQGSPDDLEVGNRTSTEAHPVPSSASGTEVVQPDGPPRLETSEFPAGPPRLPVGDHSARPGETVPAGTRGPAAKAPPKVAGRGGEVSQQPEQEGPASAAVQQCYSFGPLKSRAVAAQLLAVLRDRGAEASLREEPIREPKQYWVYLPPLESYEAAARVGARLRERGFTDFYIVGTGELKNAIALGIFNHIPGAQWRVDQLRALGFEPKIAPRGLAESARYWIDYRLSGESALDPEHLRSLLGAGIKAHGRPRPCEPQTTADTGAD